MKKMFIFLTIVVIIVALISYKYISYKNEIKEIQKENAEFDKYNGQEVYGLDVASMINKAIDKTTPKTIIAIGKIKKLTKAACLLSSKSL